MSDTQTNVSRAKAFLEAMSKSDVGSVKALVSDDFKYWVAGSTSLSGTSDLATLASAMPGFADIFPQGLRIDVTGATAELNRVALEAVSHGITAGDRTYENSYHFLFEFDGAGKISLLREYMDTAHVVDIFEKQ